MTNKEILQKYITELQKIYSKGEAKAITNIALENILNLTNQNIIKKGNEILDSEIIIKLNNALSKLLLHEPIQYVVENTWFYNLNFKVNNTVLIPRQETEELVYEAIEFLKNNKGKNILDIGTGSGCIAICLKKNIENASVIAIDVSSGALEVAKENAIRNDTAIEILQLDFLVEDDYFLLGKYDLIISNPPYIPNSETLDKNVTNYEPHLALFVAENDALIFYKQILLFAKNHLAENGKIMLEVHENLAKETAALFSSNNYEVMIKKDMQGKERMLVIYRYQKQ